MPIVAWTHSEGVEAADPTTPPAVLELASAVRSYTSLRIQPVNWHERFGASVPPAVDHSAHMSAGAQHSMPAGHAGHTESGQQAPVTTQQ
ncbi:MAG TPA: hypothetical protein VLD39_06170 [Gammaproteobacteria bacterium]|nr:hypothetical protein [Gammaproteobacteria bacterium]